MPNGNKQRYTNIEAAAAVVNTSNDNVIIDLDPKKEVMVKQNIQVKTENITSPNDPNISKDSNNSNTINVNPLIASRLNQSSDMNDSVGGNNTSTNVAPNNAAIAPGQNASNPSSPNKSRLPLYRLYRNYVTPFSSISDSISNRPLKRSRKDLHTSNMNLQPLYPKIRMTRIAGIDNQFPKNGENNGNGNFDQQGQENGVSSSSSNLPPGKGSGKNNRKKAHDKNSSKLSKNNRSGGGDSSQSEQEKFENLITNSFKELNPLGQNWMRDPADKYSQHKHQKEDSLSRPLVREGYSDSTVSSRVTGKEEYMSAYSSEFLAKMDIEKIGQDLADIKAQKMFQNSFLDHEEAVKVEIDGNNNVVDNDETTGLNSSRQRVVNFLWIPQGSPLDKHKVNKFFLDLADSSITYWIWFLGFFEKFVVFFLLEKKTKFVLNK